MLNRLDAASRLLIRASLAVFTGVVLLLIQSAFWSNRVSAWMQAIILATALLSYFRPPYGLLALAALAPLGQVGSRTLDSQMRGAEALVLAFLAGALVRGWTLGEFRSFPSTRLHIAALIFGLVVAASCMEQLWFLQIQRDFAWTFAQDFLTYASRNYFTSFNRFTMLFHAMLLLEGVALLLYTVRYTRGQPRFGERLVVMIVAGAAGTALLTIGYVVAEVFETGEAQARITEFLAARRWTVHVGDVNAAGSFFAMGMFIALGMALMTTRHRLAWLATALLLASTMWMTHSRTTIVAVLLIVACVATATTIGRAIGVGKTIALTVATFVGVAVGLWNYLGPEYFGTGAQIAVTVRWLFLGTTWRMLVSQPLFGVGIGQYFLWSQVFAAPEMANYYQRENAHNNFAQIAGELGFAGLITFIAVLAISLWWRRGAERRSNAILIPVLLALGAFILTWLGGHPLLVPEVSYPFWLTMGIVAASTSIAVGGIATRSVLLVAIVLVVSLPFRVDGHVSRIDLSGVTYGLSARQIMTSRARFFVPASESQIEFPLRARSAGEDEPVEIDVVVDGTASQTITLSDRNWQRARISMSESSERRFHQIDLQIKPGTLDNTEADRRSVEVGKWEIISKPNG